MIVIDRDMIDKFEDYVHLQGKGLDTAHKYARSIAVFAATDPDTDDLGSALAAWLNDCRAAGLAASTVRVRLAAAREFCAFLGVVSGPLGGYRPPPEREPEGHPIPGGMAEVELLIGAASGPTRHAYALCGYAGLRVGEATTIRREHVVTRNGRRCLKIHGKGEKVRYIPVSSHLEPVLDEMPETGKLVPRSNSYIRGQIRAVAIDTKVKGHDGEPVSSHDLRCTFATTVYKATKDIHLVAKLLGHAKIQTTMAYLGITSEEMQSAVEF